jgi:hypothetical protein
MKPGHREEEIQALLQKAFPKADAELRRDLWPAMLRRMEDQEPARAIPWYDWLLAACSVLLLALFPKLAWLFAYHL